MNVKKMTAVLLTAALSFTALACGSTKTSSSTKAGETTTAAAGASTTAAPAESTKAPAGDKIKTDLLVWAPSEDQSDATGNWLKTQTAAFAAEHPEWEINFKFGVLAEGDAKATVTQDVAAAADVYMYANDNLPDLIAANGIAQLGGETANYVKSTNSEAIVNSISVDGKIYGVPFTTNTWFMYYDKSKVSEEEAGSLDKMLEKVKVSFPLTNSWYIASFYVANGCTLFGDGTDEAAGIDFGGDKGTAVTKYLAELVKNPNFVNDANGKGMSGLADGSISVAFSGSWDFDNAKKALGDHFAAKSLPTVKIDGSEKQMKAFAGSKAIGVNPNAKQPQIAVALAKFLGGPEAQKAHYEMKKIIPCNTDLLKDPALQKDALVVAQNNTFDKTSIMQPFVAAMSNYWKPAEDFGKALVNGDVTVDNAAAKTEELNKSLNAKGIQ